MNLKELRLEYHAIENNILNKTFQIIAFLEDDFEIDHLGISFKGFLAFQALCKGMDIMSIKKTHDFKAF